ncbi:receptor-binding cancer antigen expressed on SiSo cells-like [Apostichopus japonicus]|uniref:receptor-binding cancer antigen expressed on SiSo cells-like n=1 Tax=Stichopus japonicus TaxID=307972 RepID=UPI003AB8E556
MAMRFNKWILCSCLAAFLGLLKSIIFRKSSKEKLDLPITKRQGPDGQEDSTEQEEELQNWETWDDDGGGLTGVRVDPAQDSQQETEMEPDFFADMTPSFKKAALIRKKTATSAARYPSSSTGLQTKYSLGVDDTANLSGELAAWTESTGGWEDEAEDDDLGIDADSFLKEKKEAERQRRLAEQQRKKAEREAQRNSQRGSSKLAVKLT